MKFGVEISQEGAPARAVLDYAQAAESLGYDSVWIPDHLKRVTAPPGSYSYEAWTTLAAVLMATRRVTGGTLVACEAFRPPALFANAVATLDQFTGGRVILGLGAGWYEEEFRAYGYAWRGAGERVERLDEALAVITRMWRGEPFEGKWYRSEGPAECARPLQQPRVPVWVGGTGPKLLRTAARHADAWNAPLLTPEQISERAERLRVLCEREGRPMVQVTYEGPVWIDTDAGRVASRLEKGRTSDNRNERIFARTAIAGTPDAVIARIREYAAVGVSHFVGYFGHTDDVRGMELFAREVIPAFR